MFHAAQRWNCRPFFSRCGWSDLGPEPLPPRATGEDWPGGDVIWRPSRSSGVRPGGTARRRASQSQGLLRRNDDRGRLLHRHVSGRNDGVQRPPWKTDEQTSEVRWPTPWLLHRLNLVWHQWVTLFCTDGSRGVAKGRPEVALLPSPLKFDRLASVRFSHFSVFLTNWLLTDWNLTRLLICVRPGICHKLSVLKKQKRVCRCYKVAFNFTFSGEIIEEIGGKSDSADTLFLTWLFWKF